MDLKFSAEKLRQLPSSLQTLLGWEQRNLWKPQRFRNSIDSPEFDARYLPENGAVFSLPCFWVRRKYLYVYGCERAHGLGVFVADGDGPEARILFPVHPVELKRQEEFLKCARAEDAVADGIVLWATPTSSTRTLLVWLDGLPELATFVKFSLQTNLFGDRRLRRAKVGGCIGLSKLVERSAGVLPEEIRYFREPLGLVLRSMPDSGLIVRSIPREIMQGGIAPAPLFALMGASGERLPLLLELMEVRGVCALEVLEDLLLARFARIWSALVFKFGLILEAHAQDLLFVPGAGVSDQGRLYYRDFEGLMVDWGLRRARHLPEGTMLAHNFEWFSAYETFGYPMYQLASIKMRASLFDYVYLVLVELEGAMMEWQARGVLPAGSVRSGELTGLFSRYLRSAIWNQFGMREPEEYDIRDRLHGFIKFLMEVRRAVIEEQSQIAMRQCVEEHLALGSIYGTTH